MANDFESEKALRSAICEALSTEDLLTALTNRFERIRTDYRMFPNTRVGRYRFAMTEMAYRDIRADDPSLALRRETFRRWTDGMLATDLKDIIHESKTESHGMAPIYRAELVFIRPDHSLKHGGL